MVPMILISTLSVVSSSSWIMIWIFMELNSVVLCTLMFKEAKSQAKETQSAMLYLMVQIISSIVFIASTINIQSYFNLCILSILALLMKAGVWPTHLWYLKTLQMMEMKSLTMKMIMTWQKIIPMVMLLIFPLKMTIMWVGLVNLISPVNMLKNSTSLKSTMILSSLNNNSWFVFSILSSLSSFLLFFSIYSTSIFITLSYFKSVKSKMQSIPKKFWETTLILANMGSIPPTPLFMAKISIIFILIYTVNSKEILTIMMLMACVFTYFYMWNTLNFLMKMNTKTQLTKIHQSVHFPLVSLLLVTSLVMLLG